MNQPQTQPVSPIAKEPEFAALIGLDWADQTHALHTALHGNPHHARPGLARSRAAR